MHMAFLSRGFKNLQWYSMTSEKTEIVLISVFFVVSEAERRVFDIIYSLFTDYGGKIML